MEAHNPHDLYLKKKKNTCAHHHHHHHEPASSENQVVYVDMMCEQGRSALNQYLTHYSNNNNNNDNCNQQQVILRQFSLHSLKHHLMNKKNNSNNNHNNNNHNNHNNNYYYMIRENQVLNELQSVRGYGVQLQLKDMEYKQLDISSMKQSSSNTNTTTTGNDNTGNTNNTNNNSDNSINGIRFNKLLNEYPQYESDLLAFQYYLQKTSGGSGSGSGDNQLLTRDIKKIQPWQIADIGIKALDVIFNQHTNNNNNNNHNNNNNNNDDDDENDHQMDSSLDQLVEYSQNFLLHVYDLINRDKDDISDYSTMVNQLKQQYEQHKSTYFDMPDPNNPSEMIRRSAIYVNGRLLDSSKLNLYSLYQILLHQEQSLLDVLVNKYGVPSSMIHTLLYDYLNNNNKNDNGGNNQHPRLDFLSDEQFVSNNVLLVNDIEKDDRYANNFPPSLRFMLQPPMYGQLRFSRRNAVTAILVLNPLQNNADAMSKLSTMLSFIWRGYPIRFGVILIPSITTSTTANNHHIQVDVTGGQQSVDDQVPSSSSSSITLDESSAKYILYIEKLCRERGIQMCMQEMFARQVHKSQHLKMSQEQEKMLLDRYRIAAKSLLSDDVSSALLMNGALYETSDEAPDRLFMTAMREQYDHVVNLIRSNALVDSDKNLLKKILEKSKTFKSYNRLIFSDQSSQNIHVELTSSLVDKDRISYSKDLSQNKKSLAKYTFIICQSQYPTLKWKAMIDEYLSQTESTRIILNDATLCKQYIPSLFGGIIAPHGKLMQFSSVQDQADFMLDHFSILKDQANAKFGRFYEKSSELFAPKGDNTEEEDNFETRSDRMFSTCTLLNSMDGGLDRVNVAHDLKDYKYQFTSLPSSSITGAVTEIVVIVDPLSKFAQKFSSILQYLNRLKLFKMTVILNPQIETSSLPLKSLYRFLIDQDKLELRLNESVQGIFTVAMDTPESWLVELTYSQYDLDNLNLAQDCEVTQGNECYIRYQLEHIVVTGSCLDLTEQKYPRGLQLELSDHEQADKNKDVTLVMANYGYFQLKAKTSSLHSLQLPKTGRHSELFSIVGWKQSSFYDQQLASARVNINALNRPNEWISVDSFDGPFIQLFVKRNPGKEKEELLSEGSEADDVQENDLEESNNTGEASNNSSFLSYFTGGASPKKTVHIFSIASGHMYERLLKIMILSVRKNMKDSTPKFWFLKQFLSPQFKTVLPQLAKHYGFKYGLVSYAWPHWLHKQQQKQRIIWAYKVLFLDVLFPLRQVKKIIFVDADQVCRTDMTELWDFDMKGNSLAYTPFCSDRKDMEGFRFWNQGYWQQHLRGKPYHISALYAVDIAQFRRQYHGDQLRMYYDSLSKDPNSLSNLDQDLPNYAQHVVPITSLPQNWLWCETWCSEESKSKAKTIDLCNNPKTKEHKLTSAKRIVPEWTEYDEEIRRYESTLSNQS